MLSVAREIDEKLVYPTVVADKSAVPFGTADTVRAEIERELSKRDVEISFKVVSNPEFLEECAAIAEICEHYDVDVESVRRGIGSDPRIGYSFVYSGAGYGGSCFPKDVRALVSMADYDDVDGSIFADVHRRNNYQKSSLVRKILSRFGDDLSGLTFCIWGTALQTRHK